jgi:hypothetical protein
MTLSPPIKRAEDIIESAPVDILSGLRDDSLVAEAWATLGAAAHASAELVRARSTFVTTLASRA